MNRAAVTIQRWFRRHTNQATLRQMLANKRKVTRSLRPAPPPLQLQPPVFVSQEWEQRTEGDGHLEQRRDDDRRRVREEKARVARLAAIQVLL